MKRIGVDTGGTFTDAVLWDDEKEVVTTVKVSSVKEDPTRAVSNAILKMGGAGDVRYLMHGTTVATNAALEGSGPRVALVCTEGFRDVLEIARLMREPEKLYDIRAAPAPSLVQRRDRLEVKERLDREGKVIHPLDEKKLVEIAGVLRKRHIKAVAVCFLHSYLNNSHEARAKEILARELPDAAISISSDVLPEFREYERTSTTVLNAYLAPVVGVYLQRLQATVAELNPQTQVWVMQSNGGVASAERAAEIPVTLLLSGPSGGVIAGQHLMDQVEIRSGITIDMGGTSFDVCLLPGGEVPMTHERRVLDMPVKGASVDILTIGAGGGSIGWVDAAGQFRVGPGSAGAVPGPACYGRGGEKPTVTDANLVLGILGDGQTLGGEVELDARAAHRACERLGKQLGVSAIEAAWGIRRIVNTTMAGATRAVSVGRGYDPRDFALIAFGGDGPMHAVDIAVELDIPNVLVPSVPGCYSALGLVVSDVTHDYVATYLAQIGDGLEPRLDGIFAELKARAHAELEGDGIDASRRDLSPFLELRYVGEQSSITVPVERNGAGWLPHTAEAFHTLHDRMYGFKALEEPIEVVNVRLRAVGRLHRGNGGRAPAAAGGRAIQPEASGKRIVSFGPGNADRLEVPVFERAAMVPGTVFEGAAIIEQNDTTFLVPPRKFMRADGYGNLWVGASRS